MDVETATMGDITVVRLMDARLDAAAALRFKENLRAVSAGGARHILLDMSAVTFMDSSGLGAIVAVRKLSGQGKTLQLAGLGPSVAKVFALTQMDRVFRIHASIDAALSDAMKVTG